MYLSKLVFFVCILIGTLGIASARDQIQIAGSSTVLPYATIVAEAFGENFDFPTPVVESGGSSAGLKKFCEGLGRNTIDIANSSRKIKETEISKCARNGVTDVIEVRIGYDGIVFASDIASNRFAFTSTDWYMAIADMVPHNGKMIKNNKAIWREVNPLFPSQPIMTFIPGTKHGTREVFEDKVILEGCKATGAYDIIKGSITDKTGQALKKATEKACITIRTDGKSVDIDGDYTETLARIEADKNGIGVFGLSFYENNTHKLQLATIFGIKPSTQTIASGEYPVSRPLYFYVKKAHIGIIPGLKEYVAFFISDEVAGYDGPLASYGLVSDPELNKTQHIVDQEETL